VADEKTENTNSKGQSRADAAMKLLEEDIDVGNIRVGRSTLGAAYIIFSDGNYDRRYQIYDRTVREELSHRLWHQGLGLPRKHELDRVIAALAVGPFNIQPPRSVIRKWFRR